MALLQYAKDSVTLQEPSVACKLSPLTDTICQLTPYDVIVRSSAMRIAQFTSTCHMAKIDTLCK